MKLATVIALAAALGTAGCASTYSAQPSRGAQFFERMDFDGDGSVSYAEISQMRANAFDRIDSDGDGFLTPDEAEYAQSQMRQRRQGRDRGRAGQRSGVANLDQDGDGLVSRSEFTSELGMITRIDQNGDGVITRSEFDAAMGRMGRRRR